MFGQMMIKTRILAILGVMAVGYLLLVAMVQFTASTTHARMGKLSTALFPAALKMQDAESAFERMKKHYGDAVVLQDASSLTNAEKDADAASAALTEVKAALAPLPELSHTADSLLAEFQALHAAEHDTYNAMLNSTAGPSDDLMGKVGELGKKNKALADEMGEFDKSISSDFQSQLDAVDASSLRSRVVGIIMFMIAIASCAIAWWVVQHNVVAPLEELSIRLCDIAQGEGDLTKRVHVNGSNEIDRVGICFNVFIERIEGIVRRVAQDARTLQEAAADLERGARATASQAQQQQQQAERITMTMNEMSSAVQEISRTTQTAALDARQAEESAHAGGETVHTTVETIGALLMSNEETSTKIEELGRSSDAIGRIISVIDEIAGQTNLLALNASIEAARAGEHGRGFAVVAGEVRRLAERTSTATKEIDETVRAIQMGTTDAVAAMRSSMAHVQNGVESARSAGVALTSIIEGSESVQKMVTQIAAAATEQSYSTQQVSTSVNEIAAIIQETAGNATQAVEGCQRLSTLATDLTGLMSSFKVSK